VKLLNDLLVIANIGIEYPDGMNVLDGSWDMKILLIIIFLNISTMRNN